MAASGGLCEPTAEAGRRNMRCSRPFLTVRCSVHLGAPIDLEGDADAHTSAWHSKEVAGILSNALKMEKRPG